MALKVSPSTSDMFKLLDSITADLCLSVWRTFILQNLPAGALRWLCDYPSSLEGNALSSVYINFKLLGRSVCALEERYHVRKTCRETSLGKMVNSSRKRCYLNSTA